MAAGATPDGRVCALEGCDELIPAGARVDAEYHHPNCRKAAHRRAKAATRRADPDDASRRSSATRRESPAPPRLCAWCGKPIPKGKRKDSAFDTKKCRQASWRFGWRGPDRPFVDGPALRFAYADPPYPGMSERWYADHPDYAGEVDHKRLVRRLLEEFPDGWALSTSSRRFTSC